MVQVGFQVLRGPLEPGYVGIEPALQGAGTSQPAAVRFGAEHLDELAPAGDEFAEVLQLSVGQGARGRTNGLSKVCNDPGIERVGLSEQASGAGEVADLARVY